MSAAGNDFIIIDLRKKNFNLSKNQIEKLSQRNVIGCDQFIILKESSNGKINVYMEIYNSDGSSSDACGNATRCTALLLFEEFNLDEVTIETAAGVLKSIKHKDSITVNMGKAKFEWQDIPLSKPIKSNNIIINGLNFSYVNIGNPHIVSFLDRELTDKDFFKYGPELENNILFPKKTNIEFVTKINNSHLKARVWERGVGETLSCGSGACAVGVLALRDKIIDCKEVKISFKGGDIYISLNKEGEILMRGGATKIFYGIIDDGFIKNIHD
jgi:diaminopimelate epimerase